MSAEQLADDLIQSIHDNADAMLALAEASGGDIQSNEDIRLGIDLGIELGWQACVHVLRERGLIA